jgi:hypothetical protein
MIYMVALTKKVYFNCKEFMKRQKFKVSGRGFLCREGVVNNYEKRLAFLLTFDF